MTILAVSNVAAQNPSIEVEDTLINKDLREIVTACATFNNPTRSFIVNYILGSLGFAKALFFNTIRSAKFIALSIFSIFSTYTKEGRSYFKENISRTFTNLTGSCVALIGIPFPFVSTIIV